MVIQQSAPTTGLMPLPRAYAYAHQRTLRLADGPDEVHRNALAKLELAKHMLNPKEVEMPITRGS